jgi:hypothetical protein
MEIGKTVSPSPFGKRGYNKKNKKIRERVTK